MRSFEIHINTVYSIKRLYEATGGEFHQDIRQREAKDGEDRQELKEAVDANLETSIRKLAREHNPGLQGFTGSGQYIWT